MDTAALRPFKQGEQVCIWLCPKGKTCMDTTDTPLVYLKEGEISLFKGGGNFLVQGKRITFP